MFQYDKNGLQAVETVFAGAGKHLLQLFTATIPGLGHGPTRCICFPFFFPLLYFLLIIYYLSFLFIFSYSCFLFFLLVSLTRTSYERYL
jgi:hypothetical protein